MSQSLYNHTCQKKKGSASCVSTVTVPVTPRPAHRDSYALDSDSDSETKGSLLHLGSTSKSSPRPMLRVGGCTGRWEIDTVSYPRPRSTAVTRSDAAVRVCSGAGSGCCLRVLKVGVRRSARPGGRVVRPPARPPSVVRARPRGQ